MQPRHVVPAALMLLLAGCVSSGTNVTTAQASQFKVGVSTEAQIVAALGEPNSTSTHVDGSSTISYIHTQAHANAASYIPVVGLLAGGTSGTNNTFAFDIDPHGVLSGMSSSSGNMNMQTGLANQR